MSRNPTKSKQECLIFAGSPMEDVNHAKSFWKSLTLQPPLESRLVSADIRQRLRVASPPEKGKLNSPGTTWEEAKTAIFLHQAHEMKKKEQKKKHKELSQKREAVLNLLHKQRLERLQKEMISIPYKPKSKDTETEFVDEYIMDEL